MRPRKRRCCSSSVIENQYLSRLDAGAHQHAFELGHRAEELLVLLVGAEAHHVLDAGAVVPAAIEQHDLAGRRQVRHVALEVPLRALAVVGRGQRHHAADARVEPLRDALDGATLAGRVAALEQDDHLLPGGRHPVLQLDQLALQAEQLLEVFLAVFPSRADHRRRRRAGRAAGGSPRRPSRALRPSCPPCRGGYGR